MIIREILVSRLMTIREILVSNLRDGARWWMLSPDSEIRLDGPDYFNDDHQNALSVKRPSPI
jgi:hypothetical protein